MFADRVKIQITSGKGGDGHISFRREKYIPDGGPDGGNGGRGGDVIFRIDPGINTLYGFKHKYKYKAGDGQEGGKRRQTGSSGADLILSVPNGTVIREFSTGKVIADMSGDNKEAVVLKGGRGGKGNMNYATSKMQAPRYAKPGGPSLSVEVLLELKLAADVGLVGLPNAGKSTFLSRVTNARPKIADYPFTTLEPSLGVVELDYDAGFVIADIPGLIEGASKGQGLGHDFLRHIERTRVLLHIVDISGTDGTDPAENILTINRELSDYNVDIMDKPMVIAANKIDALPDGGREAVDKLKDALSEYDFEIYPISAVTGTGVRELLFRLYDIIKELPEDAMKFEQEFFPEIDLNQEENDFTVEIVEEKTERYYYVEGPIIEKMLGYTNLESEKGFRYFQKFMKDRGVIDALKAEGIAEGDIVRVYGHQFEFYDD